MTALPWVRGGRLAADAVHAVLAAAGQEPARRQAAATRPAAALFAMEHGRLDDADGQDHRPS